MQKMTGQTADIAAENVAKIRVLFPTCVDAQGNIDFPALKTTLGVPVDSDKDSAANYSFVWSGKEKGRAYALAPSAGTLRPDRSKSVDFDTTKNIYIEGDNLEVLKLLRGSYANRVKMIYIDPPYNTGNDFVYNDDYSDSIESYKKLVGLVADDGKKLKTNADTTGRFHTNWLNMMFPRILLAWELLADDGVIFISIDDHEFANLKKICDEVFGEDNGLGVLTWIKKTKPINSGAARYQLQSKIEYVLVYCKGKNAPETYKFFLQSEGIRVYNKIGPNGSPCRYKDILDSDHGGKKRDTMKFPILGITPTEGCRWKIGKTEAKELETNNRLVIEDGKIKVVVYPSDEPPEILRPFWSFLGDKVGTAEDGKEELNQLMEKNVGFDTVKPLSLIQELLVHMPKDALVLDFFAGSSTTAHAVFEQNVEDAGTRRVLLVQLQEKSKAGTTMKSAGFDDICQLGEERIRRAAAKIKAEHPDFKGDLGFKVFTLDSSNVIPWNPDPSKLDLTMRDMEKNLVAGRENEDLLFEILLKKNVRLDVDIETFEVETEENGAKTKNTIYVAGGTLFVCLDEHIPGEVSSEILRLRDELVSRGELDPEIDIQVVFRETGFCDVDKTNALAILEQGGVDGGQIWTL